MKKTMLLVLLLLIQFVNAEVQLEEGFEDGVPPAGWTMIDNDGDEYLWESYGASAHEGTYSAASASWVSHKGADVKRETKKGKGPLFPDNYLITPQLSIPAEGAMLTFWAAAQDDNYLYEHFEVMVSTGAATVELFTDTLYSETISTIGWHQITVGLGSYAGLDIHIAIVHNECSDAFILKIDDVKVESVTPLPEFAIDYREMYYGMVVLGDGETRSFEIMNIGGDTLQIEEGDITLSGSDASEFQLAEIAYPVKLANSEKLNLELSFMPVTGGDKTAILQIEDNIAKAVQEVALSGRGYEPFSEFQENFDQITAPLLPYGWTSTLISSSSWPKIKTSDESADVLSAPNALELYNGDDGGALLLAVMPKLADFNLNQLDLWARESQGSGLIVGTMSDPEAEATFTPFDTLALTNDYKKYQILFDSYSGTDNYIALKHGQTSLYSNIFIDDLHWHAIPEGAEFSISPQSYDFGVVTVGKEIDKEFVITNNGCCVLAIEPGAIVLTGPDSEQFAYATSTAEIVLGPQETARLSVTFSPVSAGVKSAALMIVDNVKGINTVELSGEGFVLPEGGVEIGHEQQTEQHLPIESYFGYSYSQSLYLQQEIAVSDKRIEKIYYQYNGNSSWSDNIEIYMGHNGETAVSAWSDPENLTKVFDGVFTVPSEESWVEIVLDDPFIYNNSDNLLIGVLDKGAGYHLDNDEFYCTSSGSATMSIEAHRDNTVIDPFNPPALGSGQSNATLHKFRPNTRFQFAEIPERNVELTILNPAGSAEAGADLDYLVEIKNTGVEEDTFKLLYAGNSWEVQLLEKQGVDTVSTLVLAGLGKDSIIVRVFLPVEVLEGEQDSVEVTAVSLGDPLVSDAEYSITTVTEAISELPYSLGFEEGIIPLSWTNPFNLWHIGTEANNGEYCVQTDYDHDGTAILTTPRIDLIENQEIEFWWIDKRLAGKAAGHDTTYFEISSDGGVSWTVLEFLSSISGMDHYVREIVSLSDYAAESVYLRWRDVSDGSAYSLGCGLDDIVIREIVVDEEAPVFSAISGTEAYDGEPMLLEVEAADNSEVMDTLKVTVNIGDEEFIVDLMLTKTGSIASRNRRKDDKIYHLYNGIIDPGYPADTTGTVRFILEDVHGNMAAEEVHEIRWVFPPVLEQSFEGEFPPSGWQVKFNTPADGGLDGGNLIDPPIEDSWLQTDLFEYVYDGMYAAYISRSADHFNWLITPDIQLENGESSLRFRMWYYTGVDDDEHYWTTKFHIMIRSKDEEYSEWTPLAQYLDASANNAFASEILLNLEDYLQDKIQLAFVHEDNDGWDVAIDYVRVFSLIESSLQDQELPRHTTLFQNFPNPFNPATRIRFFHEAAGEVLLSVYNSRGQLVARPVNNIMPSGSHVVDFNGSAFNSGLYFYSLKTKAGVLTRKMIILK